MLRRREYAKSRPRTAPICAISRAEPSRSRRAARDCCKVGGMARTPPCSPRSTSRRVTSSTNSGTPPVRSLTLSTTSCDRASCAAISPTMRRTSVRSSGASATTAWCERIPQGARNSGRVVATTSSGAFAPRSANAWMRSSDVGSAQCRSSKASTTGCVLAPARSRATIAASCRLRSSSGPNFGARSAGSGISSSGARSVAVSWTSSFTWASVVSRSASRLAAATS